MSETRKELNELDKRIALIESEVGMLEELQEIAEHVLAAGRVVRLTATATYVERRTESLQAELVKIREKRKAAYDRLEWETRTGNRL